MEFNKEDLITFLQSGMQAQFYTIDDVIIKYGNCKEEALKIIIDTYNYLNSFSRENANLFLNQLMLVKDYNPNFIIETEYSSLDSSFFHPLGKIVMKDNKIETFIHELTHAIHYYEDEFRVPEEFIKFKEKFVVDEMIINLITEWIDDSKKKAKLSNDDIYNDDIYKDLEKKDPKNLKIDKSYIENVHKYRLYDFYFDIIDALVSGKLNDRGITYIKDINNLPRKTGKRSGHGEDYYSRENNDFIEILAEYATIRNSKYKDEIFKLIQIYPGQELLNILESYYNNLNGIGLKYNNKDIYTK